MRWLAVDIGGANLKVADGKGLARSMNLPLWRQSQQLTQQLRTLITGAGEAHHLAATMTGELADCFTSKEEGVAFILNAFEAAADGRHTRVYLKSGALVTPQVAHRNPALAAASNWHALARYCGQLVPQGPALVLDIGSTTCDLIPLLDGEPSATAQDDTQRLIAGELLYTGVDRTATCAVAEEVLYRDDHCPLAQESFSTMRDVYIVLGKLREDSASIVTADGRPATKPHARGRLARSICADLSIFNHRDAVAMAQSISKTQTERLAKSISKVIQKMPQRPETVILSGQGEFLGQQAIDHLGLTATVVAWSKRFGIEVSRCAPAHALANLARQAAEN